MKQFEPQASELQISFGVPPGFDVIETDLMK
jgi:hypothetical protein